MFPSFELKIFQPLPILLWSLLVTRSVFSAVCFGHPD
nr:MAG TPA: hypothetical protein [Caudoviricetes sp.]